MVRSMLATAASLVLTTTVVTHAYYLKRQFYPTVVYLTKSSPSMAVLYIQAFILVFLIGKFMRKVFFGQLRAAEMEHLIERSWYAVTETCLAFTVFRDDFSPRFVALFTLLLFLKCFHWLAEDRVDFMERSPNISWLFHFRVICEYRVAQGGPGAALLSGFAQIRTLPCLIRAAVLVFPVPPGMMPPFPPGMFPFWPPMGHLGQNLFPQPPGAAPNAAQPSASAPSGTEGQTNAANGEASRSGDSMTGTVLEPPPAGTIPGFPFSFPPFPSAPWVGMPPPPFGMAPMPMPPSGFAGLTDEELRAMEGQERQNLEARLQCLQNIHTLLDAAMVQIHQYLSVVATLSPPRPTTNMNSAPSTQSADQAPGSQADSMGDSPPAADNTSTQPLLQSEEIGQSDLEGAVGYSAPDSADLPDNEEGLLGEPDTAELRRRRLRKLDLPSAQH
uniref:E3 ubiquitin-protein ligase synoviolin n=1 Tax=Pristiophorus japonicus TaxID=55135 RepID=UPI00398E46E7